MKKESNNQVSNEVEIIDNNNSRVTIKELFLNGEIDYRFYSSTIKVRLETLDDLIDYIF